MVVGRENVVLWSLSLEDGMEREGGSIRNVRYLLTYVHTLGMRRWMYIHKREREYL